VAISSEDAKRFQFSGTEHSYDGAEVEAFRKQVIETLQAHEAELLVRQLPSDENLAAAQRARHQAVELAERMLRDVMGASGDPQSGLESWQEAAMLQAVAADEMSFATEEARRLTAIAEAESDAIRETFIQERKELRNELQQELQASRDAADEAAEAVKVAAAEEANTMVQQAVAKADEVRRASSDEARRIERRLAVLHTALADAEARFRRLAATAANEVGTLAAIVNADVPVEPQAPSTRPELYLASIDLTDPALAGEEAEDEVVDEPDSIATDPEAGFYQKRLAGLRERLEKSGHSPD